MGKVGTGCSMSLDGFIADKEGNVGPLFDWYMSGDTEYETPGGRTLKVSSASAELLRSSYGTTGALVVGRRHFDQARGWGGNHPMGVSVFVVTHSVSEEWVYEGSPFTFVTDGVEAAVEQAKVVAGDKDVGVGGANVAQQAIRAGLVDSIGVELVPILFGEGTPFFDNLGPGPIRLERTRVVEGSGVTHLRFRVVR
jgi:dihydrofolate reductase